MVFDDIRNVLGYGPGHDSEIFYSRIIRDGTTRPWSDVWEEAKSINCVEGCFVGKVMFHYTPQISGFIERNTIAGIERCLKFRPELFNSFYSFFSEAIWVYIDRRDVFAQAVSMFLAETTEIWERRLGEPLESDLSMAAIGYNYENLSRYVRDFLTEREQWQIFFQNYKISPIKISYEEAAANYPSYLTELFAAAGLEIVDSPWPRRLMKLGGPLNEKLVESLRNDVILDLYSRITPVPDSFT